MAKKDKRIQKGMQTRSTILNTTIGLIAQYGMKEISAAKIATVAGVSKSTIFHHFRSHDEIMTGTLDLVYNELLESMKSEEYHNVQHFLDTLGQSLFEDTEINQTLVKAFLSFFHEGMFNSSYQGLLNSYAEKMHEFFRTQMKELAPDYVYDETIEAVSSFILPMIDGIGFHFLLNQDKERCWKMWKWQTKGILLLLEKA